MVTTHKISKAFYDDSFKLIAVHCGLKGYAMAYHLNSAIKLQLNRREEKEGAETESFPIYEWKDELNDCYWALITNTIKEEKQNESFGLFLNEVTIDKVHLVEERKEVDYFLKLEADNTRLLDEAVKKINLIPKVVTAYHIDVATLKSKRNLIF